VKPSIAALCAFVLVLAPAACRTSSGGTAPAAVAFTTLVQSRGGELDAVPQGVIRTASGLARLWAELPDDAGPAPAIDFEREMVVYATRAAIARVVSDAGFLRVELTERTSGFHMVRLARSAAPVQFVPGR